MWLSRDLRCCFCCIKAKGQLITIHSLSGKHFFFKYSSTLIIEAKVTYILKENVLNMLVF